MNTKRTPIAERFAIKCEPEPNTGCWIWFGYTDPKGYGRIAAGGRGRGGMLAHRISWELHRGRIPDGMHVLHKCDFPTCVNPDHLFLGTNQDNIDDKVSKGRQHHPRGERCGKARLTEIQVREIKLRSSLGHSTRRIGRDFGIGSSHVSSIVRGLRWGHVA